MGLPCLPLPGGTDTRVGVDTPVPSALRSPYPRTRDATFLTRLSNDKFQAGRHHPYMGEFERVHRFLFDRRMPFLLLVVSHRAPRSR